MRVLVIQGAGMEMRGKTKIDIFGSTTLDELNGAIGAYAADLGIEVGFFHSNVESEVVDALRDAERHGFDAVLINPADYLTTSGPLPAAIRGVPLPVIEVHVSNPAARGLVSTILPSCLGSVTGVGAYGYYLALMGAKEIVVRR